jgi:hypothetical protein
MKNELGSNTLLQIPLIKETNGLSFLFSAIFHSIFVILIIFGGILIPRSAPPAGGGKTGNGIGWEEISTVRAVALPRNLSGGDGTTRSWIIPHAPAVKNEPSVESEKDIILPITDRSQNRKSEQSKTKPDTETNIVPTSKEPGSGGIPSMSSGDDKGISIGSGSEGIGDSLYARTVVARISANWTPPPKGTIVEMVFAFLVYADGTIHTIDCKKSSGNKFLDDNARRALEISSPLSLPPREYRGKPIQFEARFFYPPNR